MKIEVVPASSRIAHISGRLHAAESINGVRQLISKLSTYACRCKYKSKYFSIVRTLIRCAIWGMEKMKKGDFSPMDLLEISPAEVWTDLE